MFCFCPNLAGDCDGEHYADYTVLDTLAAGEITLLVHDGWWGSSCGAVVTQKTLSMHERWHEDQCDHGRR